MRARTTTQADNMILGCAIATVILMFMVAGCQESEIQDLKEENEALKSLLTE